MMRVSMFHNVIIPRGLDTEQRLLFYEKLRIYRRYIGKTLADVEYFEKGYNRPIIVAGQCFGWALINMLV